MCIRRYLEELHLPGFLQSPECALYVKAKHESCLTSCIVVYLIIAARQGLRPSFERNHENTTMQEYPPVNECPSLNSLSWQQTVTGLRNVATPDTSKVHHFQLVKVCGYPTCVVCEQNSTDSFPHVTIPLDQRARQATGAGATIEQGRIRQHAGHRHCALRVSGFALPPTPVL